MPTREESKSDILGRGGHDSRAGSEEPQPTQPKKPGWLEELSRKQAVRKSGLFKEQREGSKEDLLADKSNGEAAVASPTAESKPVVPAKPSQIKEEGTLELLAFGNLHSFIYCFSQPAVPAPARPSPLPNAPPPWTP